MVKIRLKRMGTTKRPFYRLVVADSRSPRDGRFIELLGHYDPLRNPAVATIDADKVKEWLRKGAMPTDSARALLQQEGILERPPMVVYPPKAKPEPAATEAPAETAAEAQAPAQAEAVAQEPVAEAAAEEPAAEAEAEPVAEASEA